MIGETEWGIGESGNEFNIQQKKKGEGVELKALLGRSLTALSLMYVCEHFDDFCCCL